MRRGSSDSNGTPQPRSAVSPGDQPSSRHVKSSNPELAPSGIVGIGASAGGLAALKSLLAKVPADSNLAFVVVTHLSAEFKSHLAELLQPHTAIPVQQVTETVEIQKNHVYVIPPNANLDTIDSHLRLSKLEENRVERAPIDHFFRTLARMHGPLAVGVVLTGTGSDGTLGLRDIKQEGGLVIVQDPAEAEYDGMPQSAIASGTIDLILPLNEIPDAIANYIRTEPKLPQLDDGAAEARVSQMLQKVFAQLRARTNRDFSRYKRSTIMRRVQRRTQLCQLEDFGDYLELLRKQPEEATILSDDLLITVTNFFRDPEVFQILETKIIPELFKNRTAEDEIRIWSVGCATGEEVYSLVMLLLEEAGRRDFSPRLQVFASDLHERSLQRAREGFYPGDIETDVSAERLKRFFTKESGGYRIRKELRETVVFAPHNLLSDPPFSRMDLIACRNVLIYLQRDVQRDIIELFHYALRPEGVLLLGTSETVEAGELFRTLDKKHCLFRKRNVPIPEPRLPVFPTARALLAPSKGPRQRASEPAAYGTLHQALLESYAPPSALISADDKLLHLSHNAGRFFLQPGGELTANIFKLIREELRMELRAGLQAVRSGRSIHKTKPVPVRFNGDSGIFELILQAAPQQEGFVLLVFNEAEQTAEGLRKTRPKENQPTPEEAALNAREEGLERELEVVQQRYQALIEEYETSQEEMKAANEEMQSTNEELRSTLEELETSKEELQSMNEELQTVNQENRHKVEELAQLSSDLQNLMAATEIATLFLDRKLRILRFTPKIGELFNVRLTDRGRPLSDLTHRLGYDNLINDASSVLKTLIPVEREVSDTQDRWYLTRVLPYRSAEDRIEGVVITFVEITDRKRAEARLRESETQLSTELAAMKRLYQVVVKLSASHEVTAAMEDVLDAAIELSGAKTGNVQLLHRGRNKLEIVAARGLSREFLDHFREVSAEDGSACARVLGSREQVTIEDVAKDKAFARHLRSLEENGLCAVHSVPLVSRDEKVIGVLSIHYPQPHSPSERVRSFLDLYARQAADFIDRKAGEDHQRMLVAELNHRVKNSLAMVMSVAEQTLRNCNSLEEFRTSYLGRLEALAQVHRLLTAHNWRGVSLSELVAAVSEPYTQTGGPALRMRGPRLTINSRTAQTLYLLLYELASNAAKYGALSVPEGLVNVTWDVQRSANGELDTLRLSWEELDGPAVKAPQRRGFGSKLIEKTLSYELGGETKLEFKESGVCCEVSVPLPVDSP